MKALSRRWAKAILAGMLTLAVSPTSGRAAAKAPSVSSPTAPSTSAATATEAPTSNPQVIVIVYAMPGGLDQVGVTYDGRVSDVQARADLAALASRAGWAPQAVRVSNERGPGDGPVMTSVECAAQVLRPATHNLPLEPILLAFRRYKRFSAVFLMPPGYPYWGPLALTASGAEVTAEKNAGGFTFHFVVTDPQVKALPYTVRDPAAPKPPPPPKRNPLALRLALVVAGTLGVAALVYGVATWLQGRSASSA